MVAPLAAVALIWDRHAERAARLFTDRTWTVRWRGRSASIGAATAISGVLMIAMGVLAVVLAFDGPGMPSGGWQTELSAWLQHLSARAQHLLSWLPGWAVAAVLIVGFAALIRRALRRPVTTAPATDPAASEATPTITEENIR